MSKWSFHLFVLPSVSFISILQFSECRSFASLGRFIPVYSILFDETVNGIVFLISLSDILLLVYRIATDLCILILCLTLFTIYSLHWLVNSSNFLVASLGFSIYSIMSSENNEGQFYSCFSISYSFYFFFFS